MADPAHPPTDDTDLALDSEPTKIPAPLWVWLVGIAVLGASLAMIVSMSMVLVTGGGGY